MEDFKNDLTEFEIKLSEIQTPKVSEDLEKIEEKPDLKHRFGTFLDKMNKLESIDGYNGSIIVCVSHAMFLKQAKAITVEKNEVENPVKVKYKYCTVSCIKFTAENTWDFVIDGASDHFIKRGLDRYDTYNSKDFVPKIGDPVSPYLKPKGLKPGEGDLELKLSGFSKVDCGEDEED